MTHEEQLAYITAGFSTLAKLLNEPLPEAEAARFQFPKCASCKHRPSFYPERERSTRWKTGITPNLYAEMSGMKPLPEFIEVIRFGILPCCTANYIKTVDHVTRRQKIEAMRQAAAQKKKS